MAGIIGGALRGAVGITKYSLAYKDVEVRYGYFASMLGVAGVIGAISAWVTHDLGVTFLGVEELSPAIALIIGYAGGDFMENMFKMLMKDADLPQKPIEILERLKSK